MSVLGDISKGLANLATANNSLSSLYKPKEVTYGEKSEPVAKSLNVPSL